MMMSSSLGVASAKPRVSLLTSSPLGVAEGHGSRSEPEGHAGEPCTSPKATAKLAWGEAPLGVPKPTVGEAHPHETL
jgi:hypothetical protein